MRDAPEVYLREVLPSDLSVHFEQQRDPESARLSVTKPRDRAAFDAQWTKILADSSGLVRSIVAGGELVGSVFCFLNGDQREVGYRVGREHWSRGIATAALALLLAEVTERPLHAAVAEHNPASLRVLEKRGFRRVGVKRDDDATMHLLRLD